MELDGLKRAWDDANDQADKQQSITPEMIEEVTQVKYRSKLKKVAYPEIIGTIICFASVVFIVLNFQKLDTAFLQFIGLSTSLLLLVLPITSLTILSQLNRLGDVGKPYAETLRRFAIHKRRFFKFQRSSLILGHILMIFTIFLSLKFFGNKDINDNKYFWVFAIPLGYIFLTFFSKWVLKNYEKALQQAEELLKELES